MSSNAITLSEMIDAALVAATVRQQEAREKQIQLMRLSQARTLTPAEIEIYGDALRDYFKAEHEKYMSDRNY